MYYTARAKTRSTPTDPNLSVQASGSRTGTTPSLTDELYGVLSPEQRSSETSLRNNTFQIITLFNSLCRRRCYLKCCPFRSHRTNPLLSKEERTSYLPTNYGNKFTSDIAPRTSDAIRKLQEKKYCAETGEKCSAARLRRIHS